MHLLVNNHLILHLIFHYFPENLALGTFGKSVTVFSTNVNLLYLLRALARKEKNYVFCMNQEIKCNWGSEEHCEPSVISLGDQGSNLLQIFSLKIVWYSLSEIIKLVCLIRNCPYNLKYSQLCSLLSLLRSRIK